MSFFCEKNAKFILLYRLFRCTRLLFRFAVLFSLAFFLSFFYIYTYNMPVFACSKTQNPRCRQIHLQIQLLFCRQKKEAPHSRHFRLHSKNFCLQGLFPSACSIHAFISAASVLKSFSKTTSISFILCRPNFR